MLHINVFFLLNFQCYIMTLRFALFFPLCSFLLWFSCEAALLQAAHPDIKRQLPVDRSFLHSATPILSVTPPTSHPAQDSSGSAARLWGRACPLGPESGHSVQLRTRLRSGPAGLRQEQPSTVQHRP